MAAWLVKTEPSTYSWDDLVRDGVAEWDGVMNAQAQINLRTMRVGDTCVVYHSMEQRAAVGLARVVKDPYPDPTDATGRRVWAVLGGVAGWFWANYKEFDEKRCNRLMMFSVIASILLLILTRLFTHQVGQDRVFLIKCDVSVLEGARDEGHAFPWISRASNLVVVLLIVLISFLAMPAVQRLLRKLIVAKCGDR